MNLKQLEEIYGMDFFAHRFREIGWRGSIICDTIIEELKPLSLVDIGCGIGDLVESFLIRGIKSWGVEGSSAAIPYRRIRKSLMIQLDLREPQKVREKASLALCFEVAEHIEPEYTEIFFDNLVQFSDTILFSSYGGKSSHAVGHVNQQPMMYWLQKFEKRGYAPVDGVGDRMRDEWLELNLERGIRAIAATVELFRRLD